MASYICTACGIGECDVGISTDECDPITFISSFRCCQGFSIGRVVLEDADGHHRDPDTGIPLGTKNGLCILDWQHCDKPEICGDCNRCQKVLKLLEEKNTETRCPNCGGEEFETVEGPLFEEDDRISAEMQCTHCGHKRWEYFDRSEIYDEDGTECEDTDD